MTSSFIQHRLSHLRPLLKTITFLSLCLSSLSNAKALEQNDEYLTKHLAMSYRRENMRVETRTHAPRSIYKVGYQVLMNNIDAKEIADIYLNENWNILKFDEVEGNIDENGELIHEIQHMITKETENRATVHYSQKYRGIEVYASDIIVTVNTKKQMVSFVSSNYKPNIFVPYIFPTVTERAAVDAALRELDIRPRHVTSLSSKLVVFLRNEENQYDFVIAWLVSMSSLKNQKTRSLEFIYDAYTGENLHIKNLINDKLNEQEIWRTDRKVTLLNHISSFNYIYMDKKNFVRGNQMKAPLISVQADANVFNPNPLATARADYFDEGFGDNDDKNNAALENQLKNVVLKNITLDECGNYFLSGPYAEVVDFDPPLEGDFNQAKSNFAYDRGHDSFEGINAYYHIDIMMRYINIELGINVSPTKYSGGVQFDPHGLNGEDNSSYDTMTQKISFGEGGVDDAEDAEVVIHFLARGLYDWLTDEKFGDLAFVSFAIIITLNVFNIIIGVI